MKKFITNTFTCFLSVIFFSSLEGTKVFSQTAADSSAKNDTLVNVLPPPPPDTTQTTNPPPPISKPESHSLVLLEFVKEKAEHSPDSTYFNILKITNNNGSVVEGVVTISLPTGWKLISNEKTTVSISPGNTEYIPIRASLARTALGGVSYLINATINSSRSLVPGKNQTSISKACYLEIPQNRKWDVYAVQRNIYFDRYSPYSPLKLKMINKGNGTEVVKLEFEIGSSLEMYGSLGNRHFTSIELRPHCDTVVSFPIKYIPHDESDLWNRDFKKLTVRVTATVDTIVKRTSMNFKYLESAYYNVLAGKVTPLNIEVQLQNLLSDANPRLLVSAYGMILLKNDDIIDYSVRFMNIPFSGYGTPADAADYLWRRSRMVAGYKSKKWEVRVGDINSYSSGFFGVVGRGIGGLYKINSDNTVGGAFTAAIGMPLYSGNIFHETLLLKRIGFRTSVNAILDNYNKMSTYGASMQLNYVFLPGHSIYLLLAAATTQHNYDNQTFLDQNGNFIVTNDPGITRLGFASQMGYQLSRKRITANINVLFATKDYSQYYSGKLNLNGNIQYTINKKYYLIGSSGLFLQDPKIYSRGILYPANKYFAGVHKIELADRVTNKLTLFAGPVLEHLSFSALKVNGTTGDSTYTYFRTISPKLSVRANYKNNASGFVSPYAMLGYTIITSAQDSTINFSPLHTPQNTFFNARAGLNVIQHNWGVNIFYYIGPRDFVTQSDYYYFGRYSKSIRIMPFFQKHYFHNKMLLSSYNSYYYEVLSNNERISLNARFTFFLDRDWTFYVDNNLFLSSMINSEGEKVYSRNYFLNLGIKKSFDIPQPRVKYYDLKVICFKDINGNQKKDENEQGLSDIVISVDRQSEKYSITGNPPVQQPGQFSPAEMVTDNFGQVIYYHIPEGDFNLNVFPLVNLKDLYNVNGQTQKVTISCDTTYYIPFVQSYRVVGRIILNRDEYSSLGAVSPANVRILATDSLGNSFPTLTTTDGSYTLYVPKAGEYKITINNVFGDQFILEETEYSVSFNGNKEFNVDFVFSEKKRQMNVNGGGSLNPNQNPSPKDTPQASATVYRIQIGSSPTQIQASQYGIKFKGAQNVKEYVENGVYKYTAGEFQTWEFDKATDYKNQLIAQGNKGAFVVFFKDGKRVK